MEKRNGRMRAETVAVPKDEVADRILTTQGVTVAYAHPTPLDATLRWRCADHEDPELFDPVDEAALAEARAFCDGCEVSGLCLRLGTSRAEWGVWGGVLLEGGKAVEKVRQRGRPKKVVAA